VEESKMRQKGQKGGRPCTGFSVKRSIYEPLSVQNPPIFFENGSGGRDLSFGQGEAENVQNPQVSKTPEVETTQEGPVASETGATQQEPVENLWKNPPQNGPEVLDILDTEKGVSKTSEAETLSSTAVSENELEVLDTFPGVYRERPDSAPATEDYREWEADDWG
jgi:hypothetical protein